MTFYDLDFLEKTFIHYAKENTRSWPEKHDQIPSSPGQVKMGKELTKQLQEIGLEAYFNEQTAFAIGKLPSNVDDTVTPIGFFSHIDTADYNAVDIQPQVHRNYDGGRVTLDEKAGLYLDPQEFPALKSCTGETLITSNGHTLLGVDDKAGITGILGMLKYLTAHPEIEHGPIFVGFGPDEEIGFGGQRFDPKDFPNVELAYTLENGRPGDFEYETFNASIAKVHIQGTAVHPGEAYGLMVNATTLMNDFLSQLPADEVPEKSKGHDGYFMVTSANSLVDHADLEIIIRDFDWDKFTAKEQFLKDLTAKLNQKYGDHRFTLNLRRQYLNIYNVIKDQPYVVNLALDAYQRLGIKPSIQTFRGGTDGNFITQKGIPTPNLFNGGGNYHGPFEYVTVEQIDKLVEVLTTICQEHLRQTREGRDNSPLKKYW
ncbi:MULTISPECIES: peptidase T [Lactobacillus]|uniref:peptidase T n=1 Tax=Lactobacillus TaxID=1578 RepID=UPI000CD7F872|nr:MULTISPECIES: peptidase T [Lactobacillus]RVU73652.1 peptidase T [Lactobacillus xujianguonis]